MAIFNSYVSLPEGNINHALFLGKLDEICYQHLLIRPSLRIFQFSVGFLGGAVHIFASAPEAPERRIDGVEKPVGWHEMIGKLDKIKRDLFHFEIVFGSSY